MNIEALRSYVLSKDYVTEDTPFDLSTLAFRVGNKIFALTNIDKLPLSINLKCDPDLAIELRETYQCVKPGFHMNKKHWNTVTLTEDATWSLIKGWIDHSYLLVYNSLPNKVKKELTDGI